MEIVLAIKMCSKCYQHKTVDNFHKNIRKRDGLASQCKECARKYNLERSESLKEYRRRPEIRKREKEVRIKYRERQDIREREKKFNQEYRKRPEVKERKRAYYRERYLLKKYGPDTKD